MKKTILYLGLAAMLLGACAKDPKTGKNVAAKRYLDSWIQLNHPDAKLTPLGAYILEETPGTGVSAGSYETNPYVLVNCTIADMSGSVSYTTDEQLSRQLGTYENQGYYGPVVWTRAEHALVAGLEESVSALSVGGTRKVLIPGWLMGADSRTGLPILYDKAEDYLEKISGGTPYVYTISLAGVIPDILKWEADSVNRYAARVFPGTTPRDTLKYGFHYRRTGAPSSEEKFKKDTTIYLNYIGRRLDGAVFDTNIADTAKFYGIYNASRTYGPVTIKWYGSEGSYANITMSSAGSSSTSTVVDGFGYALDQMHPHEQGTAIFISKWGYSSRSNGAALPAFSPLRFDFQIVDKP